MDIRVKYIILEEVKGSKSNGKNLPYLCCLTLFRFSSCNDFDSQISMVAMREHMVSKYDKSSEVNLFLFLFNYIIGFVFYLRGVNTN